MPDEKTARPGRSEPSPGNPSIMGQGSVSAPVSERKAGSSLFASAKEEVREGEAGVVTCAMLVVGNRKSEMSVRLPKRAEHVGTDVLHESDRAAEVFGRGRERPAASGMADAHVLLASRPGRLARPNAKGEGGEPFVARLEDLSDEERKVVSGLHHLFPGRRITLETWVAPAGDFGQVEG